jgi:hypothetical protein
MITGILVLLVLFLLVRIIRKNWKKIMGTIDNLIYSSNSEKLSEKYKSLHLFKSFLGICVVLLIIGSIISCVYFIDNGSPGIIPLIIISSGINIFIIMKFMMMIDFLFDLNNKIDN